MKRLIVGAVVLLAGLAPLPAQADHYSGRHWQKGGGGTSGALTIGGIRYIGVHNGADQSPWWQSQIINEATQRWNDPNWHPAHLTPSNLPEEQFPYGCDWTPPPSGWGISVCYGYPLNGAQGDAQAFNVDAQEHIGWVRIRIRPGLSVEQTRTVLVHELGHALGLAHRQPMCGSVMSPDGGCNGGWPDGHDKNVVAYLYGDGH